VTDLSKWPLCVPFEHGGSDWDAMRNAEAAIRAADWSVGPSDVTGIRGVIAAPGVRIAKWKNLTPEERAECDGVLVGRGRDAHRMLRLPVGTELPPALEAPW